MIITYPRLLPVTLTLDPYPRPLLLTLTLDLTRDPRPLPLTLDPRFSNADIRDQLQTRRLLGKLFTSYTVLANQCALRVYTCNVNFKVENQLSLYLETSKCY